MMQDNIDNIIDVVDKIFSRFYENLNAKLREDLDSNNVTVLA